MAQRDSEDTVDALDDTAAAGGALPAPHPPLTTYYAAAADRDGFVRDLFNQAAGSYDRINAAFSLGSGAWYRGGPCSAADCSRTRHCWTWRSAPGWWRGRRSASWAARPVSSAST